MAYSYGKWIDDQIDDSIAERTELQKFLNRQFEVMSGKISPNNTPEAIGKFLGKYFLSARGKLIGHWFYKFMDVFSLDIERKFKICSTTELNSRIYNIGTAYIMFCKEILAPNEYLDERFINCTNCIYIKLDMLLDLEDDLHVGYCNIPLEYLNSELKNPSDIFSLDVCDQKLIVALFVKNSIKDIRDSFNEASQMINGLKSLTFKFFLKKMYKKRLKKLISLEKSWSLLCHL